NGGLIAHESETSPAHSTSPPCWMFQKGGEGGRSALPRPGDRRYPGHHPPHRGGRWHAVSARPGRGDVKEGQLLAVLESRDLTAGAAESQAVLSQTEANLRSTTSAQVPEALVKAQTDVDIAQQTEDAAKKLLDNREKLFQQGALARKLVDDAQVAYAQAHGALLSAQEH